MADSIDPTRRDAPGGFVRSLTRREVVSQAPSLDKLIHERLRLGIISALAVHPSLSFPELKRLLDTSDGNLSVHARKLEDAGYVSCTKGFDGRTPRTEYALTDAGRRAFDAYLTSMEALIHATRGR